MMRISDITPVQALDTPNQAAKSAGSGTAFAEVFAAAVQRVETSAQAATQAVEQFVSGGTEDVHSVALAAQRASLEFDYLLQVRNKVVQAYQEVMRMQL